jgi:hypothetical protein
MGRAPAVATGCQASGFEWVSQPRRASSNDADAPKAGGRGLRGRGPTGSHLPSGRDLSGSFPTDPRKLIRADYRLSGRNPREWRCAEQGALNERRSKTSTSGFEIALRTRPEPVRFPPH